MHINVSNLMILLFYSVDRIVWLLQWQWIGGMALNIMQ